MKDYSLNTEEQKKYILSYKIEGKKIIAKLASGKSYTIPYTEENEQLVISKMKSQARKAEVEPLNIIDKILSIFLPLLLPFAIANFINYGEWILGIILVIIAKGAIKYPAKSIINAIKERDIKKLNYFLDHQQELNNNIRNLIVSQKTDSQIKSKQTEEKKLFNINNIDNYSLNDLINLREILKRISSFGFKEDESTLEEQRPVLKRALGPNKSQFTRIK